MVKLGRAKEQNRAASAPSSSGSLLCYICGASNANWPVYSRIRSTPNTPFFPFLEYQDPLPGCRSMDRRSGRVDACTVCFSFLTQQWHAYEANDTPLIKRLYWLKRSGMEPSSDKKETSQACNKAVSAEELDKALRNLDEERNLGASFDEMNESETRDELDVHVGDEKCDPTSVAQDGDATRSSCTSTGVVQTPGALETCFICGREKAKEFVRSVHTRPQLKTETPFYPCLVRHNPVATARKIDYLGKALVCEACQKFLFRQWQVFQKNNTPLGERQYQLRSDPSHVREQQSQLSTMVCFICGIKQLATSGRFLYSCKHTPGEPYFPFLGKLTPPSGAMALTQQGLTRVCSGCHKSLHRLWKRYEADGVHEEERQYHIRNATLAHVLDKGSFSELSAVACYTCSRPCAERDLCHLYTKPNTNPSNAMFFPSILANFKPPPDARPIDQAGRALVCKECRGCMEEKWFNYEQKNTPLEERVYDLRLTKTQAAVCFLCGTRCKACQKLLLYSYPQCGAGVEDGGPFFPFLSNREPAPNAQAVDPQGAVATCEICFTNLMTQWQMYESSSVPEENNRWLRKYHVAHVVCYLCGKRAHRSASGAVNKLLITFSKNHQPPRGALTVGRDRVVLCSDCEGAVKTDLEAMEDRNQSGQGTYKLKGNLDLARDELPSVDPVILIESSDNENEPACLRAKRSPLSVSASHANEPPMHYTTSASPGVHQPLLQNKDHISSVSPTSSMRSSSNRHSEASFAAALRSLAKQAVTPLSHSPASSNSGSQSPSPAVSAPTSRNTGMSPSRSSPAARSTPPSSSFLDSKSKDKRELQHQVAGRVRSPSGAPNTKFEPEHRNQTPGDSAHDSSRGPLGAEMGLHRVGHQVMPGVYSTKPHSGAPHEVAMLSERYPPNHPPPHMAYYMHHGGKPEVPVFLPRGVPGPPPLLASKRDGLEHSAVVHPFYPTPYRPPHVLDPNDLAFPTWRQQRAAEHLRQQHDRQVHFGEGYPEPFDRQVPHGIEPDRHIPLSGIERHGHSTGVERHGPPSTVEHYNPRNESPRQRTEDAPETENRKQEGPKGAPRSDSKSPDAGGKEPGNEKAGRGEKSDSMPMIRQVYYYDSKTSCPVHGHSTGPSRTSPTEVPRSHPSHGPPPGSDPLPAPKPGRPDEYNRMFLPPPPHEAPLLHPYLVHHPRDSPYSVHPLDKRQAEYFREQGRQQELYFHQHALRDQKDQMKAREEDWHHQQQQLAAHEKEAGRDPRDRSRYSHHMHRQELEHRERTRKSPFNLDAHKTDSPLERQDHRDFYRGTYALPPFYTAHPQDGGPAKPFGDHYPRGVEPHVLRNAEGRHVLKPSHGMQLPVGRFPVGYQDPYPFFPDGFHPATSMADRPYGGAGAWQRRERDLLLNGDYPTDVPRSQAHREDSSEVARRIKVERIEEESSTRRPVLKIRHSPSKLRFLEGLGLVTVDKKQELSRGEPGMKRKYDDNREIENDVEGVENKENESPLDARTDNDSSKSDSDTAQSRAEKLEFMAMLGLVPPSQRQELEKCYEVKRSERKTRKARGRPPKRARRDGEEADRDSDNSQGSNPENVTGPMTRQKQQLLQEQGILQEQRKFKGPRMDMGKELSVHVKTENTDKPSSPFSFEHRASYRGNSTDQYRNSPPVTSSERHSSHVPPRLTLQSLTNMEDPFTNLSASTFRPPYLRHTGLLSISQDLAPHAPPTQHEPRSVSQPVRPEPLRSTGITMGEHLSRDYLSQRPQAMGSEFNRQFTSQKRPGGLRSDDEQTSREHQVEAEQLAPFHESFRWPGVESVMQAYLAHATERNVEVRVLRDNAELLQMQHQSLNEEAQRLTGHIQNLAHAKSGQAEDSKELLERLRHLHYIIEGFQR